MQKRSSIILSIFTYNSGNSFITLIFCIIFLVFVILTMNSRMQFFKVIKEEDADRSMIGYALCFLISIPLFIVVYILDRIEIKGKLDQLP
jgi:ABC-type transport system involved in Fe-S cluster assembly fused permease/ATPase subunit